MMNMSLRLNFIMRTKVGDDPPSIARTYPAERRTDRQTNRQTDSLPVCPRCPGSIPLCREDKVPAKLNRLVMVQVAYPSWSGVDRCSQRI